MPPIPTVEDVVRRIAAECAYVNERGGVGIRLEPAAVIVRRCGGANPPSAGEGADASVAATVVIDVQLLLRLARGGSRAVAARGGLQFRDVPAQIDRMAQTDRVGV